MPEHSEEHRLPLRKEMQVLAVMSKEDQSKGYVFLFDVESRERLLAIFQEYAADPDLDFTKAKAELLSERVRKIAADEEQEHAKRSGQDLE